MEKDKVHPVGCDCHMCQAKKSAMLERMNPGEGEVERVFVEIVPRYAIFDPNFAQKLSEVGSMIISAGAKELLREDQEADRLVFMCRVIRKANANANKVLHEMSNTMDKSEAEKE